MERAKSMGINDMEVKQPNSSSRKLSVLGTGTHFEARS
jgi:hypothetical protein